jgi:hypothetical protein
MKLYNLIFNLLICILLVTSIRNQNDFSQKDPWSVLGLKKGSSEQQIKKKYRELAKSLHPDKNKDDPNAQNKFIEVAKAYESITDPNSEYNQEQKNRQFMNEGMHFNPHDFFNDFDDVRFHQQHHQHRQQRENVRVFRTGNGQFYFQYESSPRQQNRQSRFHQQTNNRFFFEDDFQEDPYENLNFFQYAFKNCVNFFGLGHLKFHFQILSVGFIWIILFSIIYAFVEFFSSDNKNAKSSTSSNLFALSFYLVIIGYIVENFVVIDNPFINIVLFFMRPVVMFILIFNVLYFFIDLFFNNESQEERLKKAAEAKKLARQVSMCVLILF